MIGLRSMLATAVISSLLLTSGCGDSKKFSKEKREEFAMIHGADYMDLLGKWKMDMVRSEVTGEQPYMQIFPESLVSTPIRKYGFEEDFDHRIITPVKKEGNIYIIQGSTQRLTAKRYGRVELTAFVELLDKNTIQVNFPWPDRRRDSIEPFYYTRERK